MDGIGVNFVIVTFRDIDDHQGKFELNDLMVERSDEEVNRDISPSNG